MAATGRLSSSDPNLQNIPIRSELGRKIRDAFVADDGFLMLSADYSQIELRVLAHFSGDPAFIDAFATGADIHRRTAAEVFGVKEGEVTDEQRRIAKAINFGLAFGQTDFGLAQVLRIPRHEAHEYIDRYFARYAGVRAYMQESIVEARRTQTTSTLLGRVRALPEIAAKQPQARNYAERIARNTPIQGSAADILKLATAISLPDRSSSFLWMSRPFDAAKPVIELMEKVPVTMYCSPAFASSGFGSPVSQSLTG